MFCNHITYNFNNTFEAVNYSNMFLLSSLCYAIKCHQITSCQFIVMIMTRCKFNAVVILLRTPEIFPLQKSHFKNSC